MGCHPTRCREFAENPDNYFSNLCEIIETHRTKIVAIGECGLDYDRLKFCPADIQRIYYHYFYIVEIRQKIFLKSFNEMQ